MDPTARFAELVAGPADALPLDEAVLLVAAHDHAVDVAGERERLDAIAGRCTPGDVDSVLEVLFEVDGFCGGDDDYHHPDNSFLDRVLDRRRGLPILLSIVTAEVAARAGVCLAPVGMPGHFLVRDCADADAFIDPYHAGRRLDRHQCAELFARLQPNAPFREEYLEPVTTPSVLLRLVTNLVRTFTVRGPVASLAWALHLRALLAGGDAWLHVARVRERTGAWAAAADAWDQLAADGGAAADAARARAAANRARVN